MKNIVICLLLCSSLPFVQPEKNSASLIEKQQASSNGQRPSNLLIVTIDGFRWQELFTGADASLIQNETYTADPDLMKMLYWAEDENERRQKLMPFFWSIVAAKGRLYGNRKHDNNVNTANIYNFSYPGYNEIFTGNTDWLVASNKKKWNENINVLEYLDTKETFKGKVVAFTSWNVFPYILNEQRSDLLVNSGYETMNGQNISINQGIINKVQTDVVADKGGTRYDQLTFLTAKEYLNQHRPRILFLGLGETDEYAHSGRYDLYLEQANKIDRMLAELWNWVQTTPGYKNNTTLLVTTDHGRGSRDSKWTSHSSFIKGSSQTWLAMIGPALAPLGEVKQRQQLYLQQVAALIAELVGEKFNREIKKAVLGSRRF